MPCAACWGWAESAAHPTGAWRHDRLISVSVHDIYQVVACLKHPIFTHTYLIVAMCNKPSRARWEWKLQCRVGLTQEEKRKKQRNPVKRRKETGGKSKYLKDRQDRIGCFRQPNDPNHNLIMATSRKPELSGFRFRSLYAFWGNRG